MPSLPHLPPPTPPPGPYTTPNDKPLLDEAIPESYLVLQDFIRETAEKCIRQKRKPILTKKEYMYVCVCMYVLWVG